jgi:hypothetical protein
MKFLKKLFNKNPKYKGNYKGEVAYAFTHDGVDYFMFADLYKAPYKRMCVASYFLEEVGAGAASSEAELFLEGLLKTLDASSVNLGFLVQQITAFKEKLASRFSFDGVFWAASAILIDSHEDAYGYSLVYNREKVSRWMRGSLDNFFLTMRFLTRCKLLGTQTKDLKGFLVRANQLEKAWLKNVGRGLTPTCSSYWSLKLAFNARMELLLANTATLNI